METTLAQTLTTIDDRIAYAVSKGVNGSKIQSYRLELDTLRQCGILVDLDISGTSMFYRAATWLETGVVDESTQKRFSKGRKSMLNEKREKRIKSVESRLRRALDEYSYPIKGFYPFRWIPYTVWEKWLAETERLIAELNEIKKEILDNYDDDFNQAADDFRMIAHAAWRSITGQGRMDYIIATIIGKDNDGMPAKKGKRAALTQQEFVDYIVDTALSKMPTKEDIESRLFADYTTALVYGEADVAEDEYRRAKLKAQTDLEWNRVDSERRMQQEQLFHIQHMDMLEAEAKEIKIAAMRQAEIEHARKRIQEVGSPFADIVVQLRNRIADDCKEILQSLRKNGKLRGNVAERGRNLLAYYQLMAAHDDRELRGLLEALTAAIGPQGTSKENRSSEAIADMLGQIINLTHATAKEVTQISREAFLEI